MILKPNGQPAKKPVRDLTARPQLFTFLMTGDPMQLFSSHGLDLVCRSCKLPVLPLGNAPNDGTWRIECGCTEFRCVSQAAKRRTLTGVH